LVRSGVVKRDYKDVSLNNVITLGTRVRIVVLRVITITNRSDTSPTTLAVIVCP